MMPVLASRSRRSDAYVLRQTHMRGMSLHWTVWANNGTADASSMHAGDMSSGAADRKPSELGFAVWSDDLPRVRELLTGGASADDYGDGVADKTPLMESVDELEAFYDSDRADVTRLLLK